MVDRLLIYQNSIFSHQYNKKEKRKWKQSEKYREIQINIAQSRGTEKYIKSSIWPHLVFTDGINQLRQDADCFWLVDAIASHQREEEFQVWRLEVDKEKKTAVLTMKEDTGQPELVRQEIPYTDFPLESIEFYVAVDGYGTAENWTECLVLMLKNEY